MLEPVLFLPLMKTRLTLGEVGSIEGMRSSLSIQGASHFFKMSRVDTSLYLAEMIEHELCVRLHTMLYLPGYSVCGSGFAVPV